VVNADAALGSRTGSIPAFANAVVAALASRGAAAGRGPQLSAEANSQLNSTAGLPPPPQQQPGFGSQAPAAHALQGHDDSCPMQQGLDADVRACELEVSCRAMVAAGVGSVRVAALLSPLSCRHVNVHS
jgi:hypothetical protein